MRIIASLFVLLFSISCPARAATVAYDIGGNLQSEFIHPGCFSCSTTTTFFIGTLTGVHTGDRVDLGEVLIEAAVLSSRGSNFVILGRPFLQDDVAYNVPAIEQFKAYLESQYDYGPCEADTCSLNGSAVGIADVENIKVDHKIIYVAPGDDPFIMLGWVGPYTYSSPTISAIPEPSTWAMMLIGFAGMGFMVHGHRLFSKKIKT